MANDVIELTENDRANMARLIPFLDYKDAAGRTGWFVHIVDGAAVLADDNGIEIWYCDPDKLQRVWAEE